MVESMIKLLGETNLAADDIKAKAAPVKLAPPSIPEHHESFLEELARKECRMFPCREHRSVGLQGHEDATTNSAYHEGGNDESNDDEDRVLEERRQFHLLQWDDDDEADDESEDYVTDDDIDNIDDIDNNDVLLNEFDGDSLESVNESDDELENDHIADQPSNGWEDRTSMSAMKPQHELLSLQMNPITNLLIGLANSENEPLIRADIDWHSMTTCPNLASFYPATELDDPHGARLLQGTLRMDPTLEAIEKILDAFPKSCLDMSGFFAACQFANPKTSRKVRHSGRKKLHPLLLKSQNKRSKLNPSRDDDDENDDDGGYDSDDSDVGEVVKLVMHRTINARKSSNIEWGMVAFLGDARTSAAHTKELLWHNPEALIDTHHGAFGVSPLDRMVSGNFIHGDTKAWAEKLRLALRAAVFVRLTKEQMEQEEANVEDTTNKEITLPKGFFAPYSQFLRTVNSFLSLNDMNVDTPSTNQPQDLSLQSFYPYHELIRILISPSFGGTKFGDAGFLHTLDACTNSDPNAFLRPDNEGNLPIHVALSSDCNTALGIRGERRLIRYLLNLDHHSALCPENNGKGRLPLRMSIKNGWPVYDLIVNSALACGDTIGSKTAYDPNDVTYRFKDHIAQIMVNKPLLHDALSGGYHPRFGIHGARQLVKKIVRRTSADEPSQSCLQSSLRSFIDSRGRTALHVALERKWPVYDIIIQGNPFCLEAHDPTKHGFFPFQIAACAFNCSLEAGEYHVDDHNIAEDVCRFESAENPELLETSMLFELIRESPLCVSWTKANGKVSNSDLMCYEKERHACSMALLAVNEEDTNQIARKRRMSSGS